MLADAVDFASLARYSNAPWLVIQHEGAADDGLFARDGNGNPLCWDGEKKALATALEAGVTPVLYATVLAALPASAGVLVERWLFFAEARHSVMLYYGARAV